MKYLSQTWWVPKGQLNLTSLCIWQEFKKHRKLHFQRVEWRLVLASKLRGSEKASGVLFLWKVSTKYKKLGNKRTYFYNRQRFGPKTWQWLNFHFFFSSLNFFFVIFFLMKAFITESKKGLVVLCCLSLAHAKKLQLSSLREKIFANMFSQVLESCIKIFMCFAS